MKSLGLYSAIYRLRVSTQAVVSELPALTGIRGQEDQAEPITVA